MGERGAVRAGLLALIAAGACSSAPTKSATVIPQAPPTSEADELARDHVCESIPTLSSSPKPHDSDAAVVVRISTRGYREPEKVCKYLRTHAGGPIDNAVIDKDVHDLWETGLFDDVEVWRQGIAGGLALTFSLKARPSFASTRLDGVRGIPGVDTSLLPAAGALVDKAQLFKVKRSILDELAVNGYEHADVSYTTERQEDGSNELVFNVEAHAQTVVEKVIFAGNKSVKDGDLMAVMGTIPGHPFSRDMLTRDALVVAAAYYDRGYLMVQVDEPTVVESPAGDSAQVTIDIREGDVYRLGAVHVAGDLLQPEKEYLKSFWSSKQNDVFSRATVIADIEKMKDYQAQRGFQSSIEPVTEIHADKKTIDITLRISPAGRP